MVIFILISLFVIVATNLSINQMYVFFPFAAK